MKWLTLFIICFSLLFVNHNFYGSGRLMAQIEEIPEESPVKKPTEKKEEPKKENKNENKNENEQKAPTVTDPKLAEPVPAEQSLDPAKGNVPEKLKYFREKYEFTFDKPYDVVWNAIKKTLSDIGCMIASENNRQTETGLYKGIIKSDFCVFAGGDTVFKTLRKYSLDMPFISGGIWLNGRMQYNFILKEQTDGKVYLLIKGEMSGFENHVTHEVHYWKSNGYWESKILEVTKANAENPPKKE